MLFVPWLALAPAWLLRPRPGRLPLIFAAPECEDCAAIKSWWTDHPAVTAGVTLVAVNVDGARHLHGADHAGNGASR